jgi:hypothetical protein
MERVVLRFRPDVHGFSFGNSFTFDRTERAVLAGIGTSAGFALAGLLPPDPLLQIAAPVVLGGYLAFGTLPAYGLCGGLAYSAADHWRARVPLPRGNGREPVRRGAGAPVRAMLWNRLIESLTTGGVLLRTLHWMLLLNTVPQFLGGGAEGLLARSRSEYLALKSRLQLGMPVPIGIVGTTLAAWDQHQILVYGYEETSPTRTRLLVYDPNGPRGYGQPAHEFVDVDFSASVLSFTWPSMNSSIGTVRGFFCSAYGLQAVDPTLALRFGQFQRDSLTPTRIYRLVDGAKFELRGGSTELVRLGALPADVLTSERTLEVMNLPDTGAEVPCDDRQLLMDGSLLRELGRRPVFVSAGGALFAADAAAIAFFGGAATVRDVPLGSLAGFPRGPQQGQLLRELGSTTVWLIDSGRKCEMTAHANFARHGGHGAVRPVPDGALAALPLGPRQPQPAPGECQRLRTAEARLVVELARADEAVDIAPPRRLPGARARRLRIANELAVTRGRLQVLGC